MDLRQYLLSVTAAALVCAIAARVIPQKGTVAVLSKQIMGLFLAMTLLSPLVDLQLQQLEDLSQQLQQDAQQAVQEGVDESDGILRQRIKQEVAAYILNKAQNLGLSLTVQVELSDDAVPVPKRVTLKGDASPYAKGRLQDMIAADIGIAKEDQLWK